MWMPQMSEFAANTLTIYICQKRRSQVRTWGCSDEMEKIKHKLNVKVEDRNLENQQIQGALVAWLQLGFRRHAFEDLFNF